MKYLLWYDTEKPHKGINGSTPIDFTLNSTFPNRKIPICYEVIQTLDNISTQDNNYTLMIYSTFLFYLAEKLKEIKLLKTHKLVHLSSHQGFGILKNHLHCFNLEKTQLKLGMRRSHVSYFLKNKGISLNWYYCFKCLKVLHYLLKSG
jgi:hypothetical protein